MSTTSTTLTEIVMSENISVDIMDYLIDHNVILQHALVEDLAGKPTLTAAFPRWIKDAAADLATEGTTDMSATALETEEVTCTAAQVGILREVSKMASRSNLLGEQGLVDFIESDGAALCLEMVEDDLAALATGFSTVAGETTTDASIANLVSAQMSRRTNKAKGRAVFILDDQQLSDVSLAVAASSAQIFSGGASQSLLNGRSDGYAGNFLGDEVYYTNLTDTSNTGAAVNGMYITTAQDGEMGRKYASLAVAMKWQPELESESDVSKSVKQHAIDMCYGVVERYDGTGVRIRTDA